MAVREEMYTPATMQHVPSVLYRLHSCGLASLRSGYWQIAYLLDAKPAGCSKPRLSSVVDWCEQVIVHLAIWLYIGTMK